VLEDRSRLYCDECLTELRLDRPRTIGAAHERLRELQESGQAPLARPDVRGKIGRNNRARQKAILEWEAKHGRDWDPEVFRREIFPGLRRLTVTRMASASGLSIQYCSRIRSGQNIPHPMHWDALRAVITPEGGTRAP